MINVSVSVSSRLLVITLKLAVSFLYVCDSPCVGMRRYQAKKRTCLFSVYLSFIMLLKTQYYNNSTTLLSYCLLKYISDVSLSY